LKQNIILFVCTGNTCRSVMAKFLFNKLKEQFAPELKYQSDSAGISAIEGIPPTRETIICMAKRGLDVSTYQSKVATQDLISNSSHILPMTYQQLNFLKKKYPKEASKMFLFSPYCNKSKTITNQEIDDPYGKSISFYEITCKKIEQDISKLIKNLRKET